MATELTPMDARIPLEDIIAATRLLIRLPYFLRHSITVDEAKRILRRRLQNREEDFLTIARKVVYAYRTHPYYQLLKQAGCEYGDLERTVHQEGVEGALQILFRHGVYLTVAEFKGSKPLVRGSTKIEMDAGQLRNPLSTPHYR